MYDKTGLQAIIHGLIDGGCLFSTNVPGAESYSIFEGIGGTEISSNEKIAFEMAYGASMAGKRSVVCFKSVGLNASFDPFVHAVLNGINAGLVLVLIDDVEVASSPERQDSRPLRDVFGGLWLEPNSVDQAYQMAYTSFNWSEKSNMPVVIRLTNQYFRYKGFYERKPIQYSSLKIESNRSKYISYWKTRNDRHIKDLRITENLTADLFRLFSADNDKGVIMFGSCWEELYEKHYDCYDRLEITSYPFPEEIVKKFLRKYKELIILEQGNGYASQKIKQLLLPNNIDITTDTGKILSNEKAWKVWNNLQNLFKGLHQVNPSFVVGDEGEFTDESTKTIQVCLCMGSSVGVTLGLAASGVSYPIAVTGDVSFLHGGIIALYEAVKRKLAIGIIVIDNGGAQSTGGQKIAGNIYDLPNEINSKVVYYSETPILEFKNLISDMKMKKGISILFVRI